MKYIVKNTGGFGMMNGKEVLTKLLNQRGVEDVDAFLNPTPSLLHSPFLLKNMNEGIDLLAKHLNQKSRILILIDSDCDGFGSASIMYQFIKDISRIECDYITHRDKRHGLYEDLFENYGYEFDLIICPDSASNDVEMCQKLKAMGKDILIIDHHLIEVENPHAIVINNQDGQYPNDTLVAGAVVYKFCQAFKQVYDINVDMRKYLPLAALTLISDMADLRNLESRLMTIEGLKLFHLNSFLRELCDKQSFSMKDKRTIKTVAWSIAPLINATIRLGEYEDKIKMFEALCEFKTELPYKPKKSKNNPNPTEVMETIQHHMARKCANIKKRQDDSVKKNVNLLVDEIETQQLDKNKIIMVEAGELPQSYTGLVANKLAQKYKRPCLILRRKGDKEVYGGSGRNYSKFELDDLRTFLMDSKLMSASGHSDAFGIHLPASNVGLIMDYANEQLKDVEIQDVYHVDYEFPLGQLSSHDVLAIGQYQDIWGSSFCEEPLFAITDIFVTPDQIELIGEKRNILRVQTKVGNQQLTFVKFFANEQIYDQMIHRTRTGFYTTKDKRFKLTIVGYFKKNEWKDGEVEGQIEIVDFTSELATNRSLF